MKRTQELKPMQEIQKKYNAIVVDDNEIDRLSVQLLVKNYPFIQLAGAYTSAEEALPYITDKIDVLLLDIDMPGISGLDLKKQAGKNKVCIFITSHPEHAVESFELAALDFIVKPLHKDRFAITMERLQEYLTISHKADLFECSLGGDAFFIKDGHQQIKIMLHEILYLEALKDYTRIVTKQKKYCVLYLLGNLLQETSFHSFVRIHRSYAVQKNSINKITSNEVVLQGISLPLGRSFKNSVDEVVRLGKG